MKMPNFCSKCGAKIDEDSAFCMMCGTKIKEKSEPKVEEKKPIKKTVEKDAQPKPATSTPPTPVQIQRQPESQKKKPKTALIIGIVAIIVTIVVVLVVVFVFIFQGGSTNGDGGGGSGDIIKFYGTWDTSLAVPFTFNSDTTWDMEIPLLGSIQVGYWTIKDNKIHLTASLSDDWSYLSGAYEYEFSSDGNTCTLTSTITSYFAITLIR